jgi:hypothetical protein|tara:strand:- start:202 stop:384 length:183 start_codon:yes stop_codon:yes gene_type:complete
LKPDPPWQTLGTGIRQATGDVFWNTASAWRSNTSSRAAPAIPVFQPFIDDFGYGGGAADG